MTTTIMKVFITFASLVLAFQIITGAVALRCYSGMDGAYVRLDCQGSCFFEKDTTWARCTESDNEVNKVQSVLNEKPEEAHTLLGCTTGRQDEECFMYSYAELCFCNTDYCNGKYDNESEI